MKGNFQEGFQLGVQFELHNRVSSRDTNFFFFWSIENSQRPKKMRKRPDNWSTNRLTKTTWTGLLYEVLQKGILKYVILL